MATLPPQSKADVDERFEKQIKQLVSISQNRDEYHSNPGTVLNWMAPADWNGDPRDLEGMKAPFDRQGLNTKYEEIHRDAANAGTTGDVIAVKVQADWLAMAERAFRVRQASVCRDNCHMFARHAGHKNPKGVFQYGVLGYVQDMLKAAKTASPQDGPT